jgi:hypothetical protein
MALFRAAGPVVSALQKHVVVEFDANPTEEKIRQRILKGDRVENGFLGLDTPAPTYDLSQFLVLGNEKRVLVGACFHDSVPRLSGLHGKSMADDIEIVINPFDDDLGYVQFCFGLSGKKPEASTSAHRDSEPVSEVVVNTHLPYPEGQSSGFDGIRLAGYRWRDENICGYAINGSRMRWLFAWFETKDVFQKGNRAGFNIVRHRPYLNESSSWNYAGGNGFQDAMSLGKVYKFGHAPEVLSDVKADLAGDVLKVTGVVSKAKAKLTVTDPEGGTAEVQVTWKGEEFQAVVQTGGKRGRFALSGEAGGTVMEPGVVAIDLPDPAKAKAFVPALLWDIPDNLISNYYTPERFDDDFGAWKKLGVQRAHWIDYTNWPSLWLGKDGMGFWGNNYTKSVKHCGDLVTAACAAAKRQGMEFVVDFKTFDIGFNCFTESKPFKKSTAYETLEKKWSAVVPEIAAARGATWAGNPAWRREPNLPVTKVVLYSDEELPKLKPGSVTVLVSADNVKFTKVKATVKTGTVTRGHERWTPAGPVADKGSAKNWFIELSEFKSDKPYLAVKINGEAFNLWQRGFMFVRAYGADGKECVATPATSGNLERGFSFWKGWQGWTNQTEAVVQRRVWRSDCMGVVFDEDTNMATLLEPGFEESRKIWLGRIGHFMRAGADGVSIRTYCQHNGPWHHLKYAFAAPVVETFKSLYKRDPELRDEDYERIRNIRGDFYTQFMQEASKAVRGAGKKFMVELESGIEVPTNLHVRMQLPMQWKRWIQEGLVDEVRVKWFTPWSKYVHGEILPFARKHDVKVQVISRCMHTGPGHRFIEQASDMVGDTVRSGFDGYCWYESQSFSDLNAAGKLTFKGPMPAYFATVKETLEAMAAGK